MPKSRERQREAERALLVLCWIVVTAAAALFTFSVPANLGAPSIGMKWQRGSGVVLSIWQHGPAKEAGIEVGDVIARVGERSFGTGPLLFEGQPEEPVPVFVRRNGKTVRFLLVPRSRSTELWQRWRSGGTATLGALATILRPLVSVLGLLVAATLLALRPSIPSARLAALTLASWAAWSNVLYIPGVGNWLSHFGVGGTLLLFLDCFFLAGFFAFLLHFALLFPEPLPAIRGDLVRNGLPYALAMPLFFASVANTVIFLSAGRRPLLAGPAAMLTYGATLFGVSLLILLARFRTLSPPSDLRRLRLVLASLVPALLSWIILVLLELLPVSGMVKATGEVMQWIGSAVTVSLFAYVVVRHRIFGLRPLIRKSIQYAFARGTLLLAMFLPAIALLVYLYLHRYESLVEVVSSDSAGLIALLLSSILLFRSRRYLLDAIDRRFFREEYDARQGLLRVVSMIERGTDIMVVGRVALMEIDRAFHPAHVSLWLVDSGGEHFQRVLVRGDLPETPRLPRDEALVRTSELPIGSEMDSGALRRTTPETQEWLSATKADLIVPLTVDEDVMGFLLLGERLSEEPYSMEDRSLLMSIAAQLALTEDYGRLEILARRDPLTEALNRHAFYSLLEKKRIFPFQSTAGCVALIDLDDLKAINDALGHAAGDLAIRRVAIAIRSIVRADDLVFRWGGDEFLVVLYGIAIEEVSTRMELLNERIRELSGESDFALDVTVSFGIAAFEEITFIPAAIEDADRAMYARKGAGKRNGERQDYGEA